MKCAGIEYETEKKQLVRINTREWVRNANTKKSLEHDWVFAGSRLIPNPLDPKKTIFLANDGDQLPSPRDDTHTHVG